MPSKQLLRPEFRLLETLQFGRVFITADLTVTHRVEVWRRVGGRQYMGILRRQEGFALQPALPVDLRTGRFAHGLTGQELLVVDTDLSPNPFVAATKKKLIDMVAAELSRAYQRVPQPSLGPRSKKGVEPTRRLHLSASRPANADPKAKGKGPSAKGRARGV